MFFSVRFKRVCVCVCVYIWGSVHTLGVFRCVCVDVDLRLQSQPLLVVIWVQLSRSAHRLSGDIWCLQLKTTGIPVFQCVRRTGSLFTKWRLAGSCNMVARGICSIRVSMTTRAGWNRKSRPLERDAGLPTWSHLSVFTVVRCVHTRRRVQRPLWM